MDNCNDKGIQIERATVHRKIVTRDGDFALKQKLNNYYKHYESSLFNIFSNIELLKHMTNETENLDVLFEMAPCFMNNVYKNTWQSLIVSINNLFNESSTSLDKFLLFCEQNEGKIFTDDLYYAIVPKGEVVEDDSFEKRVRETDIKAVIKSLQEEIKNHSSELNTIQIVRDKIYAHFDKKMLKKEERERVLKEVSIGMIETLATLAEKVYNGIYYYDKFTYTYCKPTNSGDVFDIVRACRMYEKYKSRIVRQELLGE